MSKEEYISIVTEELTSLRAQRETAQKRLNHFNQINVGDSLLADIYRERHNIMLLNIRISFLEQIIQSEAYYRIKNMTDAEATSYIDAKASLLDGEINTLEAKINEAKAKYTALSRQQVDLIERYSKVTDEASKLSIEEESTRIQKELHLYDEFFADSIINKYRHQIEECKAKKRKIKDHTPEEVRQIFMDKFAPTFTPSVSMQLVFSQIAPADAEKFATYCDRLFESVKDDPNKILELCGLLYDYYNFENNSISSDERSFTLQELDRIREILGDADTTTLNPNKFRSVKANMEHNLKISTPFASTLRDILEELPLKISDIPIATKATYKAAWQHRRLKNPQLGLGQVADLHLSHIGTLYEEAKQLESKIIKFSKDKKRIRENYQKIDDERRDLICELIDKIFSNQRVIGVMFGGSYPKYEEWKRLPLPEKYNQASTFVREAYEDFNQYITTLQEQTKSNISFLAQMKERASLPQDEYRKSIVRRIKALAGPNFSLEDLSELEGDRKEFPKGIRTLYHPVGYGYQNIDLDQIMSFIYYRAIMTFADRRAKEKANAKEDVIKNAWAQDNLDSEYGGSSSDYHDSYAKLIEELANDSEAMAIMEELTPKPSKHK